MVDKKCIVVLVVIGVFVIMVIFLIVIFLKKLVFDESKQLQLLVLFIFFIESKNLKFIICMYLDLIKKYKGNILLIYYLFLNCFLDFI